MTVRSVFFGDVAGAISKTIGNVTAIDMIHSGKDSSVRDITIDVADTKESELVEALKRQEGLKVINVSDRTFLVHLAVKSPCSRLCLSRTGTICPASPDRVRVGEPESGDQPQRYPII